MSDATPDISPKRLPCGEQAGQAGCDRQDFSEAFDFLNGILGTDAQFIKPITIR